MGLKKAVITFTNESGDTVARTLTVKDVVFHYEEAKVEIIYRSTPTDVDKAKIAAPSYFSQIIDINLGDSSILSLVLAVSDKLWEIVPTEPFVAVPEYDEIAKRIVITRKAITEL